VYDNGTNVGIGTVNPGAKLEVADTVGAAPNILLISSPDQSTALSRLLLKAGNSEARLQFIPLSTNI